MLRKQSVLSTALCLIGVLAMMPAFVTAAPRISVHAGGDLNEAVVVGDVAYLGNGASISVWQLSADGMTPPVRVGETLPLPGLVRGLAVSGDHLFATWANADFQGELVVYSLVDPLNPVHALDFAYSTGSFLQPADVLAIGDTLILTDPESGVYSIDISDPLAPSVNTQVFTYSLTSLALTGSHVVAWGAGFAGFVVEVINVTNPSSPSTVSYYSSWGLFDSAAVEGDVMMLAGDGFEVVSLTDPTMPAMLTTVPSSGTYFHDVLMHGDLAYIGDENGLQVWDLSTPATPVAGGLATSPSDRTEVSALHTISGGLELIQFTGMGRGLVFDLDTPAAPTLEHVFDLPVGTDTYDVFTLAGGEIAVSDFYSGLRIMDADLNSIGRVDPAIQYGGYEHLAVAGTTAYMTSWGYGLLILDVSDPSSPTQLSSVPIAYASAVDVNADMAYVVTSTSGGFLQIVDVADPLTPVSRGSLSISKGVDVVYHDSMVLIADEDFGGSGLKIIDISNPDSPMVLGAYTDCATASGVAADGELAFLACNDGTMHVVSITDPAMPAQVGVYSDPSIFIQASSIGQADDVVWFGHLSGVDVIDVSDPTQPTRTMRLATAGAVRGMEVDEEGNAWLAAANGGLYRAQSVVFRDGFESGDLGAWSSVVD